MFPLSASRLPGFKIITLALLGLLFWWSQALAGEVRLKNGDRISGKIIAMDGEDLKIKTTYAGELGISWDEVASISSENDLTFKTKDGAVIKGKAGEPVSGQVSIKGQGVPVKVALAEVQEINPPDRQSLRVKGQVNLGADIQHGNTSKTNLDADGRIVADWGVVHRMIFGVESHREENKGTDTVDKDLGYLEYNRFIDEKWYGLGNLRAMRDKFKDIDLRSALGAGLGYQFWRNEKTNFSVELGPNWIYEKGEKRGERDWVAARWALNYDRWLWGKWVQFFHRHTLFVRVDDADDTQLNTRTGLTAPLGKGFAVTLQYNWDLDERPEPGKEKEDSRMILKLGYHW